MVEIEIVGDTMHVRVKGTDRFLATKSHLEVPIAKITRVQIGIDAQTWDDLRHSFRAGTTQGNMVVGAFRHHGEWMFWDIHDPTRAIEIFVADEKFRKIIVEVHDPAATAALINAALR